MLILFPSDPLRRRRVDEHFRDEAAAARELGHQVALVDHDALTGGGDPDEAVAGVPAATQAVYRGWMLRSEQYAAFGGALAAREVTLRTDAGSYRRGHELPGWYSTLARVTPRTCWSSGCERDDYERVCAELGSGPAVLRDYTKSEKHHWAEAAFVPDVADREAAWAVAQRFLELRGADVVGGLVLRGFEQFVGAEARTWWVDGSCVLVGAHPDSSDEVPPADLDLAEVAATVTRLGLPFVTVDLARRADGVWRVVELGDGQVSDRPRSLPAERFVAAIC